MKSETHVSFKTGDEVDQMESKGNGRVGDGIIKIRNDGESRQSNWI